MSSIQVIVHSSEPALSNLQDDISKAEGLMSSDAPAVNDPDPNSKNHLSFHYSPKNDINKTLSDIRLFLGSMPLAHPDRSKALQMLRSLLDQLSDSDSEAALQITLLDHIILLDRELVDLYLKENSSTKWLDASSNLANSLLKRGGFASERGGEELISEAIDIGKRRLAQIDLPSVEYAIGAGNLALALEALYNRTGELALLDEATALERQALLMSAPGHPVWVQISQHLIKSLATRSEATGNISILNDAVEIARDALARCPAEYSLHSGIKRSLAVLLESVYSRTGDEKSLDESVALLRQILAVMSTVDPDRPQICSILADSLRMCYQNTSDPSFLLEAGELGEEAFAAVPYDNAKWSTIAASLALTYRRWAQMSKGEPTALPVLTRAIVLERYILAHHTTATAADRFNQMRHLSASLYMFHEETSELGPLQESISLQREALESCPDDHPTLALICIGLAVSLLTLFNFEKRESCISEAIDLAHRALDLCDSRMKWRARITLCQAHRIRGTPFFDLNKACTYVQQCFFSDENVDELPHMITYAINNLSLMWPNDGLEVYAFCRDMLPLYTTIVHLLPVVAGFGLDRPAQLRLLRSYRSVGADAFLLAVLANEAARGLELLEVVQGLIFTQALNQRDPDLRKLPAPIAAELTQLLQGSSMPTGSLPAESILTTRDHRHRENRRIQTILRDLRSQPGLERLMIGHSADELVNVAQHHPTVLLTGSHGFHVAVIICPRQATGKRDISFIPLSEYLSDDDLIQLVSSAAEAAPGKRGSLSTADREEDEIRAMAIKKRLTESMHVKLAVLWRKLVKPILQHPSLDLSPAIGFKRPRIHWCATGQFSFLPLHAAGIYDGKTKNECCSDYVVSSYIPTLSALLRVQAAPKLTLTAKNAEVLLVAEKRAWDKTLPIIDGVEEELAVIRRAATGHELPYVHNMLGNTTVESLAAGLATANIAHLACHGVQDSDNALQSGFCLGDGKLTVSKLMELSLDNSFLAFLSACETATGDSRQPDQVIHLAAAMLFAGFKSVVATMWSMHDVDGPKVAGWFYDDLLSRPIIDADSVAYALDGAVSKLRADGVAPQRWAPFVHLGL